MHLKKDPHVICYNAIMYKISKPIIPKNGPRIMYTSFKQNRQFVKFIYHVPYWKFLKLTDRYTNVALHRTIIETYIFPDAFKNDFKKSKYNEMDIFLRDMYNAQYKL